MNGITWKLYQKESPDSRRSIWERKPIKIEQNPKREFRKRSY